MKCGCSTMVSAAERTRSRAARVGCVVLDVPEQDQRLLGEIQFARVHEHLPRGRKALGPTFALDPTQPRPQRRRPRRPDQPVVRVQRCQHARELSCPLLGGVGPVLGRPERIVGDEHLRPTAIKRAPYLLRADAVMGRPPRSELRQRDHVSDRRLAHLRRSRQHHEPVAREHVLRSLIRARRHEHARQRLRALDVQRRARRTSGDIKGARSRNPSTEGNAARSSAWRSRLRPSSAEPSTTTRPGAANDTSASAR